MNIKASVMARVRRVLDPPAKELARETPSPCLNCGYGKAIMLGTKVRADFKPSDVFDDELNRAFQERMDGICVRCGLYQAFKRFTYDQLKDINYRGKDITTSETRFHHYPAPPDFVERLNREYFGQRTERWKGYFDGVPGFAPRRTFFIRPFFGGSVKFIRERFGADVAGIDMSETCFRTVEDAVPGFRTYRGAINGMLEGDFLESGPYDALFVFHTLTHACDLHTMIRQMHGLLADGGCAVFTHEIVRKPTNPFHMVHFSEMQLRDVLHQHFDRVDRIDACDAATPSFVTNYTQKGDSPDLVAWKKPGWA